jgi:arylsulfatase
MATARTDHAVGASSRAPSRAPWRATRLALRALAFLTVALTLLALAACAPSATGAAAPAPRSVVLVCLDTVRADHLSCYGHVRPTTPALDALAARAMIFEDAHAAASWTKPSVPTFMTGIFPSEHGVFEGSAHGDAGEVSDLLPEAALTLAEVFAGHGFATGAFVHNAQIRRGSGLEQGFEVYDDSRGDAADIAAGAREWLARHAASARAERPYFLYLHFLDAHWPYDVPEADARRFAASDGEWQSMRRFWKGSGAQDLGALRDAINDGAVAWTAADRAALEALYDGALAYLDRELGRFLAELGGDVAVCVIADHGEEFGEHGKIGHGHGLTDELLRVPWILALPGAEARRVREPVSLVDLFPTLLAAAGVAAPATHEGVDRLGEPERERPRYAEHKTPGRYQHALDAPSGRLERTWRAPPLAPGASDGPGAGPALPCAVGQRWEAELVRADGRLVASQLKPREEEPDDPPELRGVLERLDAESLVVEGLEVRLAPECVVQQSEGAPDVPLAAGRQVKVTLRGVPSAFEALKVKVYPPEDRPSFELRGAVEAVEGTSSRGRVRIAGAWIEVGAATSFKGVAPGRSSRDLDRQALVEALAAGAAAAAETGWMITTEGDAALAQALDALSRRAAQRRLWSAVDREALGAETVEDLRALGYVR